MSFTSWLLGERRVTFERRHDLATYVITVIRSDGSKVSKQITDQELMTSRIPPIEIAQRLFDHTLDRVAVGIIARRTLWNDDALRAFIFSAASAATSARTWRGVSVPTPGAPHPEADRYFPDAPPLGEYLARNEVLEDRPKPLAPPNPDPDFPMYRPR